MNLHTCNYFCKRPACIRAQRDEMRDALFDQQTIADLRQKLAASEPVGWAYIHEGYCEEIGWGLPPEAVEDEATLLYAAPQHSYEGEPVAWCQQSNRDGSYGVPVVFAGYAMYEENLAKAKQDPWIVNGAAKLVPLYAAPPRTFDDGLEAAELIARLRSEATAWDAAHTHTGPLLAKLLYRAADGLAAMEQRITELTENGARLLEAADGWKTSAQHFQQERNELEAQLAEAKSIALDAESEARIANEQAEKDRDRANEAQAENAALREDAERYRWFRLQSLWDADRFPWPDGFEYPEGISEDDGKMLDAAIDAARKA